MKYQGVFVDNLRGSAGALTGSRNRYGNYFRSKTVPVNPATPAQELVRNIHRTLVDAWTTILTEEQLNDWGVYAFNTQIPDSQGGFTTLTGQAMYIRCNLPRVYAGLDRIDDGPAVFNLGSYTAPTINSFDAGNQQVDINFTPADVWANTDGAGLLIYASRPQNPTVNFFKGPYRLAAVVLGDGAVAPTSPVTVDCPFAFEAGQVLHFKVNATQGDGRYNLPFRFRGPVP